MNTDRIKSIIESAPLAYTSRRAILSIARQAKAQLDTIIDHAWETAPRELNSLLQEQILLISDASEILQMETVLRDLKQAVKDQTAADHAARTEAEIQSVLG